MAGEAAGLALGLLYAGSGTDKAAELLAYAHETQASVLPLVALGGIGGCWMESRQRCQQGSGSAGMHEQITHQFQICHLPFLALMQPCPC